MQHRSYVLEIGVRLWRWPNLLIFRFSKGKISVAEKCGENNRPCEDCGYDDCKESEKCKWRSKSESGNSKWTPGLHKHKHIGKKYPIYSCNSKRETIDSSSVKVNLR